MENSFIFLTNHKADRISCGFFYFIISTPRFLQILYARKYLELDLPAREMNAKTKIIYRKVIEEICNKYERAGEFTQNKKNELFSEHGISPEEVRLYVCYAAYTVWLRTRFRMNLFLLSFLH